MAYDRIRSALPPSRGGRPPRVLPPALKPVEQTLFMLLSRPGTWRLVDEFVGKSSETSAMRNALWRRGVEVRQRTYALDGRIVQVWARWTHDVPTSVAPWEVQL